MRIAEALQACVGFDWDADNVQKNVFKHDVTPLECEEVFFNEPLIVSQDVTHSEHEPRGFVLGQTSAGRLLFVAFTVRRQLVRVISGRDMSAGERRRYRS